MNQAAIMLMRRLPILGAAIRYWAWLSFVLSSGVHPPTHPTSASHPQVFNAYGLVHKIAIFQKFDQWQALVQYGDKFTAATAKAALEGHSIYEGGYNRMKEVAFSIHQDIQIYGSDFKRFYDFTKPTEVRQPGAA